MSESTNNIARSSAQDDESLLKWRRRNSYYYGWLDRIYKFVVRPNSRVLHIGCECGDLLAAVRPAYGVGVDGNESAIALAKKRFPHLNFIVSDPQEFQLNEKFDYVLICNSLGEWKDIQRVLERIRPLTDDNTRIVVTYYNYLWEWVLRLGSSLGIRKPRRYQNWLPPQDIANLRSLSFNMAVMNAFDLKNLDSFWMVIDSHLLPQGDGVYILCGQWDVRMYGRGLRYYYVHDIIGEINPAP